MEKLSRDELRDWLCKEVASLLDTHPEEIDLQRPLGEQGLDSVDAVGLTGELEDLLGIELDPTLAFEYPSIEALVEHLGTLKPGTEQEH